MSRTVIDLDDQMVAEAMRIYGTTIKAKAVRMAMEDAVKRHLRREFAEAVKSGELDFSEIITSTGPKDMDGTSDTGGAAA
ncbi:type II toxin-antitoxin system VapB family antitoxin [Streptomyces ipomoeae]|nr:type II toxin-antitoxin system VapB family antitoxin [Streptomyces ipomoeae]MDX2699506.1 type II toxin-antitoxin system VapB family antitoxin [Streptomyces ipomoeae]MDX2826947.1 type II toxin-antitoxin system VapB family antitoxin [Streptomyces ipomoeae]MDX2845387.1 type II toxin-antitoxin system VapB family antitoxin [Streptomyces ipomoeae]MDX2879624.1 type II toxin-antitoxin system VapB family antitoxin [Streptomyces ipomoeae]MDX2936933.1 type II toxin-antitoxin system VapB family antitox